MKNIFFVLGFFLLPSFVSAQVIFSEVMYDLKEGADGGREWIELYNNGSENEDLSDWILFENKTKHGFVSKSNSFVLLSGEYLVVVNKSGEFFIDYPNYDGAILYSSFSLSNVGEILILKDNNLNEIDRVDYLKEWGANGDGDSLQKIGEDWVAKMPTIGEVNEKFVNNEIPEPEKKIVVAISSLEQPVLALPTHPLETGLISNLKIPSIIVAKVSSLFEVEIKEDNFSLYRGKYVWNFGDGKVVEISDENSIQHSYLYPGDYIIVLYYYRNIFSKEPEITIKKSIKVVLADTVISKINFSDDGYGFVEIYNRSHYEMDLSDWILVVGDGHFKVPKNTIILPNKKIIFPSQITNLKIKKDSLIELQYPSGESNAFYTEHLKKILIKKVELIKSNLISSAVSVPAIIINEDKYEEKQISTVNSDTEQLSSVINAVQNDQVVKKQPVFDKWFLFLIIIIIFSIAIVLFVKKKESAETEDSITADDFKIID